MKQSQASSPPRSRVLPPFVAAELGILGVGVHFALVKPWRLDDAFISFRYAENLAAGHGPVYNVGERVEGYTSFLWVALLAAGHRLGADTVLLSQVLGLLFAAGTIALLAASCRWVQQVDRATASGAALLVGTCGTFTAWPASGMETMLTAFLVTWFALEHLHLFGRELEAEEHESPSPAQPPSGRRAALQGSLGALLVMTRPDAALLVGVAWLDVVRRTRSRGRGASISWRAAWCMGMGFAAVFLPYWAWRYHYYGYLLPNTFYAKVGFARAVLRRGFVYTGRFLIPGALLVAPIVAALATRRCRAALAQLAVIGVFVVLHIGYVIAVGGDSTPAFRFLAPLVPLLALLAARSHRVLLPPARALLLAVMTCVYGVVATRYVPELTPYLSNEKVAEQGEEVGRWLAQHAPPDAVLATNTAGSIPYYSHLRTIDMLGLNDVHIAHRVISDAGERHAGHEKHDGLYVLALRPQYIHFGSSRGAVEPKYAGDHEIAASPDFLRDYQLDVHKMLGRRFSYSFCLYRRKDVVER